MLRLMQQFYYRNAVRCDWLRSLLNAQTYGGPYLQTQQTLFQTQHSIIEAQQGYCRNTA